jgi:hypothetical protein
MTLEDQQEANEIMNNRETQNKVEIMRQLKNIKMKPTCEARLEHLKLY